LLGQTHHGLQEVVEKLLSERIMYLTIIGKKMKYEQRNEIPNKDEYLEWPAIREKGYKQRTARE
jgi:hypothetical protein